MDIKIKCILIVFFWYFFSCKNFSNKQTEFENNISGNNNLLSLFGVPYETQINCDSNTLMFLKDSPFDTSYLLYLSSKGNDINGVFYEVLPSYHRDLGDYYDESHKLLFFDGFNFVLDSLQWASLKKETRATIEDMSDSLLTKSVGYDNLSYILSYDNKKRQAGNSKLRQGFNIYDNYLRANLINEFLKKRIPKVKIIPH